MGLDVGSLGVGIACAYAGVAARTAAHNNFAGTLLRKNQPQFSDAEGCGNVYGGGKAGCTASRKTESGRGQRGM